MGREANPEADEFNCTNCGKVFDIENSIRKDGELYCETCSGYFFPNGPTRLMVQGDDGEEKCFGDILSDLITAGLSDSAIFEQLVNSYSQHAPEFLVAHCRVLKEKNDFPWPLGDTIAYLEMAREIFMTDHIFTVMDRMDISNEEMDRLKAQLEGFLNEGS